MSKKLIIVFEGIECSGKSFHINNVINFLKKRKKKFIKIREPGGNINSEKIRKLILNNKSKFNKNTDLLLYLTGTIALGCRILLNSKNPFLIIINDAIFLRPSAHIYGPNWRA